MSLALLLLPALALPGPSAAEAPGWTVLLPGGPQFQQGKRREGAMWAAATLGTLGWGLAVDQDPGELNAPLLYAQQIYVTGLYAGIRDLRLRAKDPGWPPQDPSSTTRLVTAPFRPSVLKSPWVWGAMGVGGGLNYVLARNAPGRRAYADLRRMRYLGGSFGREGALAAYTAYWIPISLGAGVSEEALFRGLIQTDFERHWGPRSGLWAASALFGAAHAFPIDDDSLARVAFATVGGLYFGGLFQREGYRLAKPIAAHFWFDAAGGLAVFLANPRENPLGARVEFAF